MTLDAASLRKYRERWKVVAEFEAQELRHAPVALRGEVFNRVLLMANELGLDLHEDEDTVTVYARWQQLREKHGNPTA